MDVFKVAFIAAIMIGVPVLVVFLFVFAVHRLAKEMPRSERRPGAVLGLLLGFAAGVIVWLVWLSWGGYYEDDFGQMQGPYRPWQVVACGVTMVAVTVLLGLWTRWTASGPFYAALGGTSGFSFAWAMDALPQDETGLSAFGLLMVIVGVGMGLNVVAAITSICATMWHNRLPSNT
ncbi:hypothetical protein N24_0320 [Corynebacterium suranareeae]|uniref:Uncharacterized protein n=1 Tax=Corynebacterium suranareeae TaxID=2506452 RepID=A0A169RNI3_9CORY|nr:hypothetical protein [Corynebacterium suranareeae]BAU94582.1 hypothetical protein N24_0320 [Corynebacterium suranareeae]